MLNGAQVDVATAFDGNRIALDGLAADNELRVVAEGAYMRSGEGLHRFVDPVDGSVYLYTQFETLRRPSHATPASTSPTSRRRSS